MIKYAIIFGRQTCDEAGSEKRSNSCRTHNSRTPHTANLPLIPFAMKMSAANIGLHANSCHYLSIAVGKTLKTRSDEQPKIVPSQDVASKRILRFLCDRLKTPVVARQKIIA